MPADDAPGDGEEPVGPRQPIAAEIAAALRAGRRDLGLSQRALAETAGISKTILGRLELPEADRSPRLDTVELALAAVGMRLLVQDRDGTIWDELHGLGVDLDGVHDDAGRRLPAHLFPKVINPEPYWRYYRRDRRATRQGKQARFRVRGLTFMRESTNQLRCHLLGLDPDERYR